MRFGSFRSKTAVGKKLGTKVAHQGTRHYHEDGLARGDPEDIPACAIIAIV
jgi:hypothetical protein